MFRVGEAVIVAYEISCLSSGCEEIPLNLPVIISAVLFQIRLSFQVSQVEKMGFRIRAFYFDKSVIIK